MHVSGLRQAELDVVVVYGTSQSALLQPEWRSKFEFGEMQQHMPAKSAQVTHSVHASLVHLYMIIDNVALHHRFVHGNNSGHYK